jgi:hypothetical protein
VIGMFAVTVGQGQWSTRLDAGSRIGSFTAEELLHQGGPPSLALALGAGDKSIPSASSACA